MNKSVALLTSSNVQPPTNRNARQHMKLSLNNNAQVHLKTNALQRTNKNVLHQMNKCAQPLTKQYALEEALGQDMGVAQAVGMEEALA